jgi:hypothetical protein
MTKPAALNHKPFTYFGTDTSAADFAFRLNSGSNLRLIANTDSNKVNELQSEINIKIIPNPSDGLFKININNQEKAYSVYVNDALGKVVFKREEVYDRVFVIDLMDEPTGIYFMNVIIDNKTKHFKLIKK